MKRTLNLLLIAVMVVWTLGGASAQQPPQQPAKPRANAVTRTPLAPRNLALTRFAPINFRQAALAEAQDPPEVEGEIKEIDAPKQKPDLRLGVPIPGSQSSKIVPQATPPSATGPSPGPVKSFKAEFLSATNIPPDTMGAVGTTHIVSITNDRLRIQTRDGVELARMTLTGFWAGVTIKGAAISAFDPKVMFDRFNNRFILISSGNAQNVNSGAMFAVSQTADPTGLWNRWSVPADPTSTAAGGHWIDYPSMGFNKNWIIVNENVFNYGTAGTGFWGTQIYVLDKQAAYANTLGTISLFESQFSTGCVSPFETQLGCGFTMSPTLVEDNTTEEAYLIEDWDNIAGQLRLSKLTGTAATPVLTVGTQFPQSTHGWVFNAQRITTAGTQSGGYLPQRQQSANLVSGTRIMANDSRVQNAVLRNGSLWCTHTVMLSVVPQPVPSTFGTTNPDTHSGIQWWEIDPTIETGLSEPPIQRGRIEDPTADNCHNGAANTNTVGPRCTTIATQSGEFFAFPNISVNQNDDVLIGFSRFSPLTYPNSGYVIRRASDPPNTTRDPVIFRPGQANYNIGAGSGATRQNRWGDYSASQTDPLNDTDFWSVQEYAGTQRNDFLAPSYAGPWETWWALVRPSAPVPTTSGNLIISEFRLRGPQGVRDEFVEVYNPGATPIIVSVADNSDGWALGYSTNGTTITGVAVIPNGTVIPARGHYLLANNPDNTAGGTSALTYSLNTYPSITARTADSDTGWAFDLADNGGLALFKTSNTANFNAGTRMDSVGFATIAAGLFREGAGLPAITATTPAGQMTFYRNAANGTPVDSDVNENDFIFADPVIETLGVTPRLGAAGPENLGSPIHETGAAEVAVTLLDSGAGAGSPANRFRDTTPGPLTTSTFGTLTFRRTFTNNTGNDLPRLRYRIVDVTTNPPSVGNADLRALGSVTGSVTLSGGGNVTVNGTTIENPPTQAVGGGFNSSYNATGIALATPLLAGASVNLQFTMGVQVTGNYNLCLVAEGVPFAASAVTCFTGTTENAAPSITPGGPLARGTGEPGIVDQIATVSDDLDGAGTLTVTVLSAPTGISVTGISNSGGNVSATVAADCTAALGANNVLLRVTDSQGATNDATLVVNVTAAPATPTITPTPAQVCANSTGNTASGPAGAASYAWSIVNGTITSATNIQNITYTAGASGTVDLTLVVTNAGGCSASNTVNVTINASPSTPTITPTPAQVCANSTGNTADGPAGATTYAWSIVNGTITSATNGQSITYTAGASGTVDLTLVVTNAGGCPASNTVNVTINANPTATITPTPAQVCANSTGNTASGPAGAASYAWSIVNGTITSATNIQNITYTAGASGTVDLTLVVTNAGGCSASNTVNVTINASPSTPTITPTPAQVCANSAGNTASGPAGASTYAWSIVNGTITSATNGQNITYTAGASGTVDLTLTVTNAAGCSDSDTVNVTINANPSAPTITPTPAQVCANSAGNTASGPAGATTYAWSIVNGTITSATNGQNITYTAGASGTVDLTLVVTNASGCSATNTVNVTINASPTAPTITPTPAAVCANSAGNTASGPAGATTYAWSIVNGTITSATNGQNITYTAGASGTVDLTLVVTNAGGCGASNTVNVPINPNPDASITAPGSVVTGSTGNAASVADAGVGATYNWSIVNGTITAGTGTANITFTAGAVGVLTLNVTVTTGAGCSDSDSVNIPVTAAAPIVTVTNVSPNSGTFLGGTNVTITGTGFASGASVTFDVSAATSVVVVNSTTITAVTPAHVAGAVNVTVTNTDTSTGTLINGYTYGQQFDANGDSVIDPSDIFYLVNYLFSGGPAPAGPAGMLSGDANGDSVVDPADIFYVVNYLFLGGPPPAARKAGVSTQATGARLGGSLTLGTPVVREGRTFIPVIVATRADSAQAQAMSLKLRVSGDASIVAVRRAGAVTSVEPAFELTRPTSDGAAYLVAFDGRTGLAAAGRSAVVAEIEVAHGAASARLDVDPALTMLSRGGVNQATVATGTLQVRGVTINPSRPEVRERN